MTTKPKSRKAAAKARAPKQRCITEAQAAAMDFEPWQGEVDTEELPNNEQFAEYGRLHLITCRAALVMMYKTKAELCEFFECANWPRHREGKEFFLALFQAS